MAEHRVSMIKTDEAGEDIEFIGWPKFCWLEIDRPLDEYDLSALYIQIWFSFLEPHEEKIDLVGKELRKAMWMIVSLCRIVGKLNEEIEQIQGHLLNLEKRMYPLEEKHPRKRQSKY